MLEAQCLHKLDVPLKKKDGKLDAHLPMGVECIKMIFFFFFWWMGAWVGVVCGWVGGGWVGGVLCVVDWGGLVPIHPSVQKSSPIRLL